MPTPRMISPRACAFIPASSPIPISSENLIRYPHLEPTSSFSTYPRQGRVSWKYRLPRAPSPWSPLGPIYEPCRRHWYLPLTPRAKERRSPARSLPDVKLLLGARSIKCAGIGPTGSRRLLKRRRHHRRRERRPGRARLSFSLSLSLPLLKASKFVSFSQMDSQHGH